MSKSFLPDDELKELDSLAHFSIVYLAVVAIASFLASVYVLKTRSLLALMLMGSCGSAVAALTSCLDRYALGFEHENGDPFPKTANVEKGLFNRRFARWLFVRPFLGAIVTPVFLWGLSHFTQNSQVFLTAGGMLEFTAFMTGLLAKSVLELVKNLFKNVFKS